MAVKFLDYYATLGVARTANSDEIKLSFRKLARIHHPDVAKDKIAGEAKFKELNEAYEVLGDPEKRRRYDELGPNRDKAQGSPQNDPFSEQGRAQGPGGRMPADGSFEYDGTGFSDFFESFFGGGPGARRNPSHGRREGDFGQPLAGRDIEADLLVTLAEALLGSSRKITLRRPGPDGAPERSDTYQVRVPAGVREGQRIRLAGQGDPGRGGAGNSAGDLYLRVRLARHPDFSVEGADIGFELDLAPWEAVLGVRVNIPSLDGSAALKVPPGTAAGVRLRLRGLGLPREGGGRGDLYTTVRLCTPTPVSDEERALWNQLAKITRFHPRTES